MPLIIFTLLAWFLLHSPSGAADEDVCKPNSPHVDTAFVAFSSNVNKTHVADEGEAEVSDPKTTVNSGTTVKDQLKQNTKDRIFPKQIPAILYWTNWLQIADSPVEKRCGKWSCYRTGDRKLLLHPQTRGIFLYGTDLAGEDLPLPRLQHHEWALLHEESPMNNYMLVHGPMIQQFNHTATFRRESHFPLSSQNIESVEYLLKRKPIPVTEKNKLKKMKGLASVLYIQSHCDVASDRDRYVKELMKYISVDSYGECLQNKKLPRDLQDPVESMDSPKFLNLIAEYKFHLAFENAICKDYMTEKLFRVLHVGAVPIYRGSAEAKDWMPNGHSIIMVNDFSSPKELASFIEKLDSDDVRYEQYLQYKENGIENDFLEEHLKTRGWGNVPGGNIYGDDFIKGFECYLCEQLAVRYDAEQRAKTESSVQLLPPQIADRNHLHCPQPYTSINDVDDLPKGDRYNMLLLFYLCFNIPVLLLFYLCFNIPVLLLFYLCFNIPVLVIEKLHHLITCRHTHISLIFLKSSKYSEKCHFKILYGIY